MNTRYVAPKVLALAILLIFSGCLITFDNGTSVYVDPTPGQEQLDAKRTICDPFETNSPQARDRGLVGNLFYLNHEQTKYNNVSDYMQNAQIANATIYMNRLNIPARPFNQSFYLQSGDLSEVVYTNENYSYFGLRMRGQLQLTPHENAGKYQLALLADEGALLKVSDGAGGEKIIVNNDGKHPTRFMCATEPVYMDGATRLPTTLEYYHGPGSHVSLVAMWRPWPDDPAAVNDPVCGLHGNGRFFDESVSPAVPKKIFYELLERNWKVLENANYYYPEQADNPCVKAEEPIGISALRIDFIGRDSATLTWKTNIPASSRLEAKAINPQGPIQFVESSALVLDHQLTVTGLSSLTIYAFKASSVSASGQTALGDELVRKTGR